MLGSKLSDRYEIVSELGRGGMGVVYRAHDPLLDREVAIKLIPPSMLSPDAEQRFQHEAKVVAQMDHPAIVSIYDFGHHEGSLFFVMPIARGSNLRLILKEGSLSLGDVLDSGIQIAEALEYSHSRGVIHRDIKPENIMVEREGGKLRIRVMDFGLARVATETRITKSGMLVGTMSYLSPEQVEAKNVDSRSDIYSLGTVLYECVAGEPPFSGELQSILYRIVHELPQPPRSLGVSIDEELEGIILSCLAKDPAKRPRKTAEVVEALTRYRSKLGDSDRFMSLVQTRVLTVPRQALSPFVGRAKEIAELQQRLNAAVGGECQFAIIGGEPGIGKTRLLDEIEKLASARKITVLHGRFFEQNGSFPYQGFCEAFQEYFRSRDSGSKPGGPDFSDLAPELISLFPMLGEIGELASPATGESSFTRTGDSQGTESRTRVFEVLARTLTRIAGGRALVLVFEDLHGAQISIEALQYIVRRLGPTPTLVLGSYRSTEIDTRHPLTRLIEGFRGDRRFSSILLGPFSPSEHRKFLETLVGGPELSETLVNKLYEGTEGNPFFTKEIVRSLLDSGGIARDDTGAWGLSGERGISAEALPETIQQVVEKRIERLPEDLREILSIASVIGKTFDVRDLENLTGKNGEIEDAVDRLILEGLIEEERESRSDRLTFSSGVVRDVLYAQLSRRKRRSLHRKYAEQLEQRHRGRPERILPQLVHQYSQGDVPGKTVEYAFQLARISLEAFSAEEAVRSMKTALEFLDEEWEGDSSVEGDARLLLARSYRMAGDIDAAIKEAETAIKIFERESRKPQKVQALLLAAETAWQSRRAEDVHKWVQQGIAAARESGELESLRELLSLAATLANLRGEYKKANEYLAESASINRDSKEAEEEEERPKGGKLVVALATPVNSIEPSTHDLVEEAEILMNVFEPLLATDHEGHLVPALCEKWELSAGGRSLLLSLRSSIKFHDGNLLTAAAVKSSFERSIRQMPRELPAAYASIEGVTPFVEGKADEVSGIAIQADNKIEIKLSAPLPIYPALLTDSHTGITRAVHEEGKSQDIVGTGPYKVAVLEKERILLERNQDYWKGFPPVLDTVEFRPGMNASSIAHGLRRGDIDIARDLLPEDLDEILRDQRFRKGLIESPKKNTYFVLFNSNGPATRNPQVRRALSGAIRSRDLVWQTLGRFAQPAACLIPPGLMGHDAGRRRKLFTKQEAADILNSAGLALPIKLKASVHPLLKDRYESLLTALFSVWSEIGAETSLERADMPSYLNSFQSNEDLDLIIMRWAPDYSDPDNFTHNFFHSHSGFLRNYFSSPESDQLLEDARAESRASVRDSLYRKFETLLEDSAILVPLFHDIDYRVVGPKVRGLKLQSNAPYLNYSELGKIEVEAGAEVSVKGGGTLQIPIVGSVTSLDPSLTIATEHSELLPNIFETLTRVVGTAGIEPWLASEFRTEDGGRKYRFILRNDVRFHDGRRLTARDVRYSFERLLRNPESASRWNYSSIKGARALLDGKAADLEGFTIHSAAEFTIEMEDPIAFFPALISYTAAAIVPEGTIHVGGRPQDGAVGTGPFRVVGFEPGRQLELERNPTYWRQGYPRSDGLTFCLNVSPQNVLQQFRSGRFAIASDLLPQDLEALRHEPEYASGYQEAPRLGTYYAAFNARRGPLKDKRLRQSIVEAINTAALLKQIPGRLAIAANGLIPPGLLGHDESYDSRHGSGAALKTSEKANVELDIAVHPVFHGVFQDIRREFMERLRESGFKIRREVTGFTEWIEATSEANVDVAIGRWFADYPDSHSFVQLVHSEEGQLGRFYASREIDNLIAMGRTESRAASRHSIYREIEQLIVREALLIPLFHEQLYRFVRPEVEGLSVSPWVPAVNYANLRMRS